jgi:hypothetical protein
MLFFGGILSTVLITPAASFFVYQLVYLVNPDSRWWAASIPGIQYSFIAAMLMLFMLAINYKKLTEQAPWRKQPPVKWMLGLLTMYVVMIHIAILPEMHSRFTFDFAKLIIVILVAYKLISTEKVFDVCLWIYILGSTYIGYLAYSLGRNWQGRVEGIGMIDTGGDGNMTAAAIAPALILLMYFAWLGNKKIKLLAIICGALIANGIVLINSRGAFLGVMVGALIFLFYMIFSKYQYKGQRGTAVLIVIIMLSGSLYVADDAFWARMQTMENIEDGSTSGSHRIEFWMATFDVLRDYPLGVGIQGFIELSPAYLPEHYFENRTTGKAVHSTWFQLLNEVGWLGLILFIGMLFSLFRMGRKAKLYLINFEDYRNYFKIQALEAAFVSYLVSASFINRARAEVLFWLILFLMISFNIYYLSKEIKNLNDDHK